jgi:hypothetical protein
MLKVGKTMSEPKTQTHPEMAPSPERTTAPVATPNPFAAATATTSASITPMKKGEVSGIGQWVFDHKQSFSRDNPFAWYGIRNVLNNMVAIVGLMATIVPVRWGMGKLAQKADQAGLTKVGFGLAHPILQNMAGVGVSFSTFRTLYKMGQRSYDRIFGDPKSAEEASQAVADLPKNIWKDFWQIAPVEYPATMTAAIALVGIRAAVNAGPRSGPTEAVGNNLKDTLGCAFLAYPVFFEMTERLGRDWQLHRGYADPKTNEHINKDKMTMGEFLMRQVPAVAAGIIPYISLNNLAYRAQGKNNRQVTYNHGFSEAINKGTLKADGFFSAFWKEKPYELFFLYTLGRDLYYDAYDWMTGKSSVPGKHAEAAPKPASPGVVMADAVPAAKSPIAVSNHPTVEVADAAPLGKLVPAPKEHKKPTHPAANHAALATNDHHQGARHAV